MGKLLNGTLANRLSKIRSIINAKAGSGILTNENEIKTAETLQKFFYSGDEPQYNWIFIQNFRYHSGTYFNNLAAKSLPMIGNWDGISTENNTICIRYNQSMTSVLKFDWSIYTTLYIEYWVWDENTWRPPHIDIFLLDKGNTPTSQSPKMTMISHGKTSKAALYEDDLITRERELGYIKFTIPRNVGYAKLHLKSLATRDSQKIFINRIGVN